MHAPFILIIASLFAPFVSSDLRTSFHASDVLEGSDLASSEKLQSDIDSVLSKYRREIDETVFDNLAKDMQDMVQSYKYKYSSLEVLENGKDSNSSSESLDDVSIVHRNEEILPNLIMSLFLTLCAALAAGLTMGLVSIEPLEMMIKLRSGTAKEIKQAKRILPLVSKHHFLLVSLLLFNSLANEALPLFLENIFSPFMAVIISVTLILLLGEILPSAIFTGPHQLKIASSLTPLVWMLMIIFSPVAWPIGKILDFMLGIEDLKRYNRAEISALMELQHDLSTRHHKMSLENSSDLEKNGNEELYFECPLHRDEVAIVQGVLDVGQKSVADAMISMDKVYSLSIDEKLTEDCLASIIAAGYSRIPIFEGGNTKNLRGYLQVKKLIVLNPEDSRLIRSLELRKPEVVGPQKSLLELLNIFQLGRAHIAFVSDDPNATRKALRNGTELTGNAQPIGIISLEDILEEILQEEIMDESDLVAGHAEARAKATLAKYARKRKTRLQKVASTPAGRHAFIMPDSPKNSDLFNIREASSGSISLSNDEIFINSVLESTPLHTVIEKSLYSTMT